MNYDLEANIISWEVGKGTISRVREFGNFIVHLSPTGKPILVEILDASKFKTKLSKVETIQRISQAFGS